MTKPELTCDAKEAIAKVCHEANRAWCELHGDKTQKSWEDAESWRKESAMKGVEFRLQNPDAKPSAQHEAWLKDKIENGWEYGEKKDIEAKTHPCILMFESLPEYQKMKDIIFCSIVDSLKSIVRE